nr:hypothetical protein [Bacillus sp. Xin]
MRELEVLMKKLENVVFKRISSLLNEGIVNWSQIKQTLVRSIRTIFVLRNWSASNDSSNHYGSVRKGKTSFGIFQHILVLRAKMNLYPYYAKDAILFVEIYIKNSVFSL